MSPETISASAATVGLLLTALALWKRARAAHLATFNSVRERLQDMALRYGSEFIGKPEAQQQLFDGTFFNELEWLAYLINHRCVSRRLALDHMGPTILGWYEGIFEFRATQVDKDDPLAYSELKALVKELRKNPTVQASPASARKRQWLNWNFQAGGIRASLELAQNASTDQREGSRHPN